MRLKNLKIFGFKSFADAATLNFAGNIVAIVGPNGCGKSNIVDAFRWVMGEQSARSMRGDKMQDILFAGCDGHPPLNFAEVSLSFTEAAEKLSLPYDEITITRKLHRNGESEYLLNCQPIRVKDLQLLLSGTGIGKNAYSVFEQGKLDQIIYLSPLERRHIFDDAAGIGRFLQQKKDIVRKLEEVSENQQRARDLYAEIEKQTAHLKKQAAQAQSYNEQKKQLEQLEIAILVEKRKIGINSANKTRSQIESIEEQIQTTHQLISQLQQRIVELNEKKELHEQSVQKKRERFYQLKGLLQVATLEKEKNQNKLIEAEEKNARLKDAIASILQSQQECSQSYTRNQQKLSNIQLENQKREVEAKRHVFTILEKEAADLQLERKTAHAEHLFMLDQEKKLSEVKQKKELVYSNTLQKKESHLEKCEQLKENLFKLEKEKNLKKGLVTSLVQEIDKFKVDINQYEKEVKNTRSSLQTLQKESAALNQKITETSARRAALERLKSEFEGFSAGAKQILAASQNPKSVLYKKIQMLSEYLTPEEIPVLAAMLPYQDTLVVQTKEHLVLVIEHAKEHAWKDYSILCIECVPKDQFLHGSRIASELLDVLKRKTFREKMTQDNFWIDTKGVIFSGDFTEGKSDAFLREKEFGDLALELADLEKQHAKKMNEIAKAGKSLDSVEAKRSSLEIEYRKKEMSLIEANFALQNVKSEIATSEDELQQYKEELSSFEPLIRETEVEIYNFNQQLQAIKAKIVEHANGSKERESLLETQLKKRQEAFLAMQTEEKRYDLLVTEWQKRREEIKNLEIQEREYVLRHERMAQEQSACRTAIRDAKDMLVKCENEIALYGSDLESMTSFLSVWEESHKSHLLEIKMTEKDLYKHSNTLSILETQKNQLDANLIEKELVVKNLEATLKERFAISQDEADERSSRSELSLKDMEQEAAALNRLLEKTVNVNLAAIEEYEEQKKRCTFLADQLADLEAAQHELEAILVQLDGESRKLFKETFQQIRQNFQKNFEILFQGGHADLKFTDSPDILEAGVEIVAQPPGKQMRSLSLLSGGEKCLAAVALLFAIFEVRPAPFCILDEVDAPLDDSNIDRFTKMLKQFVDKTQFIIVTHNKKTMAIADILLGVSMEKKGISQLITLEFQSN